MEATPQQAAEGLQIVRVLAAVLDRLVQANVPIARADPGQVTKFHAMKAPGITVLQYLERIHKYASCSNECYILALVYIDRLIQRNNFLLTELNVHRVVVTAVLLAAKFFDDAYYNNAYYAKIGGVLVSEMNGLEVDFLFRINFSLHVTPDNFEQYRNELWSHSSQMMETASFVPAPVPIPPPSVAIYQPLAVAPPLRQDHHQTGTSQTLSQITPSPPAEAARMEDYEISLSSDSCFPDMEYGPHDPNFPLMQRSNSMPAQQHKVIPAAPRNYSSAPVHVRCYTNADEQYFAVLNNQIYQNAPTDYDQVGAHCLSQMLAKGF